MSVRGMTQEEKINYMTTKHVPSLICELAVPTIISMLVTAFYNMADTFFCRKAEYTIYSSGRHRVYGNGADSGIWLLLWAGKR